jgi:hypothetical protein
MEVPQMELRPFGFVARERIEVCAVRPIIVLRNMAAGVDL